MPLILLLLVRQWQRQQRCFSNGRVGVGWQKSKTCASSAHLNSFPTFRLIKFAFFVFCNVANLTESYANNARWKAMVCNAISPDARIPLSNLLCQPACTRCIARTLCRVSLLCAHFVRCARTLFKMCAHPSQSSLLSLYLLLQFLPHPSSSLSSSRNGIVSQVLSCLILA